MVSSMTAYILVGELIVRQTTHEDLNEIGYGQWCCHECTVAVNRLIIELAAGLADLASSRFGLPQSWMS